MLNFRESERKNGSLPMLSASECRDLANSYKARAKEQGIPPQRASLLRNISRTLNGLANQLDMLAEDAETTRTGGRSTP